MRFSLFKCTFLYSDQHNRSMTDNYTTKLSSATKELKQLAKELFELKANTFEGCDISWWDIFNVVVDFYN